MPSSLPSKAANLIPHRRGMKLIDQLTSYSEDDATATLEVQPDNLFLNKRQQLDNVVLVELLAQTAAAHSGYKALSGLGDPMFGFLVGIKDFKVFGSAQMGNQLTLSIHRDFQMKNVSFLVGKVHCEKELLAEGILKLWEIPATESGTSQSPIIPEKLEPFGQYSEDQSELIKLSTLNRDIIQHCISFESDTESGVAEADFCYSENFIGFEGHFPDNPIVPGVLMLKTGLLLAELAIGQKLRLRNIHTAKFAKTVLPNERIRYTLSISENKIKVQVKSKETLCAKFTLEAG